MRKITEPVTKDEFESYVIKIPIAGCWIWGRGVGSGKPGFRYGLLRRSGVVHRAHRLSYELWNGPIPNGMHVLHQCDVTECCNPNHLFIGTNLDNIADCKAKGRTKGRGLQLNKSV